jgi:hypothetical protein
MSYGLWCMVKGSGFEIWVIGLGFLGSRAGKAFGIQSLSV